MTADWLASEGYEPVRVSNFARALDEIKERSFDLLLADYNFAFGESTKAFAVVRGRNAKTPIVIVGNPDAAHESQALARGAMYLPRPVDRTSLVCAVSMGLMDSRPERRSPRKRVARFEAVVEGIPSHIVDVSNEGLRLEIPRSKKSAPPPPYFNVKVPIIGVTLSVRRMWTCNLPDAAREASWYGGELTRNARRVELAWLSFVDTIPSPGTKLEVH